MLHKNGQEGIKEKKRKFDWAIALWDLLSPVVSSDEHEARRLSQRVTKQGRLSHD